MMMKWSTLLPCDITYRFNWVKLCTVRIIQLFCSRHSTHNQLISFEVLMKIPLLHFRVVMWVKLVAKQRKLQQRREQRQIGSELHRKLIFHYIFRLFPTHRSHSKQICGKSLDFWGNWRAKKLITKALMLKNYLFVAKTSTVSLFWSPRKEKWKNHRHSPTSVWRVWSEDMMETHLENGKIHCVVLCACCFSFFLISLHSSFGRSFHFPSLHMNKLHYSSHEDDLWDVRQSVSFRLLIL